MHALACLGSVQNRENTWSNFKKLTNPPRNIFGQFWPSTLLSFLDFAPATLNLDLYQMPALISHFMHNRESHQGLGWLNLEYVIKSWIASDLPFLLFNF